MSRPIRRRSLLVASAALALATGLAGCAGTAASVGTGSGEPRVGGDFVYLDAEIPVSAQIQESGTWQDRGLLQNLTDRLLARDADTGEFVPWLAESWEVSEDGLTYTFVIRDGVTYSDGTPLDAASVKRNIDWWIQGDPENGISPNPQFPPAAEVAADDATSTVTVTLPAPYAPFLAVLTSWSAGFVADATIEASRDDQSLFRNLIGSGPFTVTSETYGKEYVLSRREGYAWAPANSENQGEAYLDTVTIIPVQEDSVRLGTVRSNQANLLRYVQPSEEPALEAAGFQIVAKSGVGVTNQWIVEQTAPFLDEANVRLALTHAIDREQLVEDLYSDSWSAATSVLSPGTFGYVDESALFAYDPAESERLLDEVGFTEVDGEGFRTRDGERLTVKTYLDVYDNTARALFQAIQAQWKAVGIELTIAELDYSSYWATAFADPEVGVLRLGWPHPDGGTGLAEYYAADAMDPLRLKGSDANLESLLAEQGVATSDESRLDLLAQLQTTLLESAYVIPILDDSQVYVAGQTVRGFALSDGALPQYYNVWLDE